ncbi:MAG: hypothetical protein IPO35_15485 [Uliginosibacterium sp.]|jgi:hypothetical protein|nr:hypothetical protein [Uliginosibacterium sp.]MBK9616828.1 hypothetical protein [Uliginosibacterium sp.]
MDTRHRIIFSGKIKEGFDPVLVKKLTAFKLKASPEQISRLFSGRRAIIKKNLSLPRAERYANDLAKIGLIVVIQMEPPTPEHHVAVPSAPSKTSETVRQDLRSEITAPFYDSLTTQLNIGALNPSRLASSQ